MTWEGHWGLNRLNLGFAMIRPSWGCFTDTSESVDTGLAWWGCDLHSQAFGTYASGPLAWCNALLPCLEIRNV